MNSACLRCTGAEDGTTDEGGTTELMRTAARGCLKCVNELLGIGAKPVNKAHIFAKDLTKSTVLMYAVEGGNPGVVRLVLSKARELLTKEELSRFVNEKDDDGDSALLVAVKMSRVPDESRGQLVNLLTDCGADTSVQDRHGRTFSSIWETRKPYAFASISAEAWERHFANLC